MAPTPVFLPGESHGQRGLAGHSLWARGESAWRGTEHTRPPPEPRSRPPPHPRAVTERGLSAAGSAVAHWLSVLHVGLFICQLYSPISSHLKFFFTETLGIKQNLLAVCWGGGGQGRAGGRPPRAVLSGLLAQRSHGNREQQPNTVQQVGKQRTHSTGWVREGEAAADGGPERLLIHSLVRTFRQASQRARP